MSPSHLPGAAAPLPSPTSVRSDQYFTSLQPQAQQYLQAQHQQQRFPLQVPQAPRIPPPQTQQRQDSISSASSETSLLMKDFSLVAEAAKRAQVAVMTRDLEEVQL